MARRLAALLLAACLAQLTGCASPAYTLQAASGHLKLMTAREPVAAYLADAAPDDPLVPRLRVAREVLAFAGESLHLPADGSYETVVRTSGSAITWNVVATPPYDMTPQRWCFLVAGCVPYRGYFERADAERFADRLRDRGQDVAVSGAGAYSTLGWFEDPLLESMLLRPDPDLADILIHELAHQALYVPGDATFNESFAGFLAEQGVRAWMAASGREAELDAWLARQRAGEAFIELLAETRRSLAAFYASETDPLRLAQGKRAHFAELERRYAELVATRWKGQDRYASWFEPPPNNADLALVGTYTDGWCAFDRLWQTAKGDFHRFLALARERAGKDAGARARWMAEACDDPVLARGMARGNSTGVFKRPPPR
ncbi:MAG: aminopeptidase [Xanthomonadales bacterium]|jgi:predicted aminopeptidase|nr:aminopeptidase [Xanthomonadales bacterium]